jgi:hypothetical protein
MCGDRPSRPMRHGLGHGASSHRKPSRCVPLAANIFIEKTSWRSCAGPGCPFRVSSSSAVTARSVFGQGFASCDGIISGEHSLPVVTRSLASHAGHHCGSPDRTFATSDCMMRHVDMSRRPNKSLELTAGIPAVGGLSQIQACGFPDSGCARGI